MVNLQENFDFINPDLLIGNDDALVFFDEKGAILKFNNDSKKYYEKLENFSKRFLTII